MSAVSTAAPDLAALGPHVWHPGSGATGREPEPPPLLLLHGMGGDERTLLPLARRLSPGSAVLSLRGPVLEGGAPRFYERSPEGAVDEADLADRAAVLAEQLRAAGPALGVAPGQWVAVGFSNGSLFAAALLMLQPHLLAGALLLAARSPHPQPPPLLGGAPSGRWAVVCHGQADEITTPAQAHELVAQLRGHEVAVEVVSHPRGHNIDPRTVPVMARLLASASGGTPPGSRRG